MTTDNITKCTNPDCQAMAEQWLEMVDEKLKPLPGVEWFFHVPFTRIVVQKVEKY